MEFAVACLALCVDEFVRVRSVTVHVTKTVGSASITKQKHDLMGGLGTKGEEVPEHVRILQLSVDYHYSIGC